MTSSLAPLFLMALGQMLVLLLLGGIDLSVTSVIAIASETGGLVVNAESGWLRHSALAVPVGLAAMLAAGAATGLFGGEARAGACGHHAAAARVSGVPGQGVTVAAHVLCRLLAAISPS